MLGESANVSAKTKNSSRQNSKLACRISTRGESSDSLLGETVNNKGSSHKSIESIINKNIESLDLLLHEAIETINESNILSNDETPSTRGESSGSLLGEKGIDKPNKSEDIPFIKNVGFVNKKWTDILVDNEAESDEMDRDEIKKPIIQMTKKEEHNPLDNWTDRFIRVNHKTYVSVEVAPAARCTHHSYRQKSQKSALVRKFVHPASPITKIKSQQQKRLSRWNIHG